MHLSEELKTQVERLKNALPPHSEISRLIGSLDDPASDEASKDRYVAIVAANAVEGALRLRLADHPSVSSHSEKWKFDKRIKVAEKVGLVTSKQAVELNRVREVRNIFAHALLPVSFSTPAVVEITELFWNHPINDWAGYFTPIFPPRHRFAIVCGSFVRHLEPVF